MRRLPFPDVAEKIQEGLDEYSSQVEEVTKKTNVTPDSFNEGDMLGDTAGMPRGTQSQDTSSYKTPRLVS